MIFRQSKIPVKAPKIECPGNRIFYDFSACFLIILSHFTNYVIYANYTKFFPDIILVVGILFFLALALTALLQIRSTIVRAALFTVLISIVIADAIFEYGTANLSARLIALSATFLITLALVFFLRKHTNKVLIGAFLAMLFSSLIIGSYQNFEDTTINATASSGANSTLPVVVHLVLDEHLGAAGMTAQLPGGKKISDELREFYTRAGFRLFSHAYSQYFRTSSSLATAMNFDSTDKPNQFLTQHRYGFSLNKNSYLEKYAALGYKINIYQSNYFNFCHLESVSPEKCISYKPDSIDSTVVENLSLGTRVQLLARMYYSSIAVVKLIKLAEGPVNLWLNEYGIPLPRLELWHGRVGPVAVVPTLDRMIKDIAMSKGGTLFFGHLLMPHYPYVYTSACTLRPDISSWLLRMPADGTNTRTSRRRRYSDYFEQLRCTMRKLEPLFAVMKRNGTYENAIIVIHGDHGSRISKLEPTAGNESALSLEDFLDGYSTLFVLKAPGVSPGVDLRMLPLPNLLSFAVTRDAQGPVPDTSPTVFVGGAAEKFIELSLPAFPALPD